MPDAVDVRALQAPLKERYRADPGSSRIVLTARGDAGDTPMSCSIEVGRAIHDAQAHAGVGGAGTAGCSGDLLLGALAACAQITFQMVAAASGIAVRGVETTVTGELDLAGTLGIDREAPVGFTRIALDVAIDAPGASDEDIASLARRTERYCVVAQTLRAPPELEVRVSARA
jgi:uncharacterized OsmC-like protein